MKNDVDKNNIPLMISIFQGIVMGVFKVALTLLSGSWQFTFSAFYNIGIAMVRGAIPKKKAQ